MMNGKRWLALGIAALIFLLSIVFSTLSNTLWASPTDTSDMLFGSGIKEEVIESGNPLNKIVVLEVSGTIMDTGQSDPFSSISYNHQTFMKQLEAVKEDESVRGVILIVDSPGGAVLPSVEIHDKLKEIMEERDIPVYVSMGTYAASGGYYISAPATKIFAHKETLTGSIGVILQTYDLSGLYEKLGVKIQTLKTGEFKDIGTSDREMTDEEKQILQTLIENSYDDFVKVVAEGRGMSESEVRAIADGRIYDGRQAYELNLVDELGFVDDAIAAMKEDYDIEDAQVVRFEGESFSLSSLFGVMAKNLSKNSEEEMLLEQLLNMSNTPQIMYLYSN